MAQKQIQGLISYAREKLELKERDGEYKANRLLEIMQSGLEGAELEDAVYGELSLLPSEIDERFSEIIKESGSKAATEWLYNYCVNNNYVKKDVLDKNPRFDTSNGLVITINKTKPEFRDPNKAKAGNSVAELNNSHKACFSSLPQVLRKRVEHVVSECERVRLAASALKAGNMEMLGRLLNLSHASLRNNYSRTRLWKPLKAKAVAWVHAL